MNKGPLREPLWFAGDSLLVHHLVAALILGAV